MRLDKLLAKTGFGTRKEVKALIKKKQVTVGGQVVKDSGLQISPSKDTVNVNGEMVHYRDFIYLMMNKPPDYVSATTDDRDQTVIDLLSPAYQLFDPFPVGRLDKNTEGLLLITNDGKLAHQLTSPNKAVGKTYFADIEGHVTEADAEKFRRGVTLDDGYTAKSAMLKILRVGHVSQVHVTVTEGKFHQVKRMFEAIGKKVIYLKRIQMGTLTLDSSLETGQFRELTDAELKKLTV